MQKTKTRMIAEGALMLALAIALTFISPFPFLPFGGRITLISMFPICLFSIKYGVLRGFGVSFLFSLFQLFQGIVTEGLLGWGLTPGVLIACILLDYILAYSVLCLAGLWRKKGVSGWILGSIFALFLRFVSHFLSGIFLFASVGKIWDELDFVASNKYIYSAVYNGAYMLPEIIMTAIAAIILFEIPQMRRLIEGKDSAQQ